MCGLVRLITLPRYYKAGHAVRNTGAGCQEGDAHDDIRNTKSEANNRNLIHTNKCLHFDSNRKHTNTSERGLSPIYV